MPVTYHCENPACTAIATALWVTTDQGKRVLIPPPRWRLVDVEEKDADPVLLCVTCGEVWETHKQSKKSRKVVLGVLEGGRGIEPTIPAGSGPVAAQAFLARSPFAPRVVPAEVSDGVCSICGSLDAGDMRMVDDHPVCASCAPAPRAG